MPPVTTTNWPRRGFWSSLWGLIRQRCPRCQQAPMFCGLFHMNDPCPKCGLIFQREEGYFLGAMYISYVLGTGILVPLYFLSAALFSDQGDAVVMAVAFAPYLFITPLVFRYSRVVWVYLDRSVDPSEINAGPTEKTQLSQRERAAVNQQEQGPGA